MPKKRPQNKRKTVPRLLIFCEGDKTEPNYLRYYIREFNIDSRYLDLRVVNTEKNSPKELVEEAIESKQFANDKAWAVFDRDGYTKHNEAFQKAKGKVDVAFSSISFEFWILLHFTYTTRHFLKSGNVIDEIRNKGYMPYSMKHFNKELKRDKEIYSKLKDKTQIATKNAKRLRAYQVKNNPSTSVHKLNPYTNIDELLLTIKEFVNQ